MHAQLLIDAIVQQTTVLIAQLATSTGVRSPLAHVANETFLALVRELRNQGVTQKVIADMFGMALSSYRQKVQRLSESRTERGKSLWQAVYSFLQQQQSVSREEVLLRFKHDDADNVAAILNDLAETGLIYQSGRGHGARYRVRGENEFDATETGDELSSAATLVWVTITRHGPITRDDLTQHVPLEPSLLDRALDSLLDDGRVQRNGSGSAAQLTCDDCVIPLGDAAGWEGAVLDHYQAVVAALCHKLRSLSGETNNAAETGGSTFTFDVWPGHPLRDRSRGLLAEYRDNVAALWDEMSAHNDRHPPPADNLERVTFYFGQYVRTENENEAEPCD